MVGISNTFIYNTTIRFPMFGAHDIVYSHIHAIVMERESWPMPRVAIAVGKRTRNSVVDIR